MVTGCVRLSLTDVTVTIQYDTEIAKKLGWGPFLCVGYSPGKDIELILTVKMETRHPVDGSLMEVNFRRFVIVAEL